MEKIETRIKTIEQRYHHFNCDGCGVHLGISEEHDDGYYQSFGDFDLAWHTPAGWWRSKKCLCDQCKEKYLSEVYTALERLRFKKEN